MNRKLILFDEQSPLNQSEIGLVNISNGASSSPHSEILSSKTINCTDRDSNITETQVQYTSISQDCHDQANCLSHGVTVGSAFRSSDYRLATNIFIGLILAQYILIFFAIPFSEVDNRPAASVLLCLFGYLLFVLCILMVPAGLINVPSNLSYQTLLISCFLKGIDLGANAYALVLCLKVREPMIEYTYDQNRVPMVPLEITLYIQIVSCLLLVMSAVSLFFAMVVFLFNFTYFQAKVLVSATTHEKNTVNLIS